MAGNEPSLSVNDEPAEMVAAAWAIGDRYAARFCGFMRHLPPRVTRELPPNLPAEFMFDAAAALALIRWEEQGYFFHREAGLPDGWPALHDAMRLLSEPDARPFDLHEAVLTLALERFSWSAPAELGAEIALDEAPEDALLDALADFLSARRPR